MIKQLSILGLFLFLVSCSTTAVQPENQLAVIETWSGYAIGRGAECADAKVEVKVLEDYSIKGVAHANRFNLIIRLRGKVDPNNDFFATGAGSGGVFVTYKGIVNGDSASGTWDSSLDDCRGTWELAKNSQ